MRISVGYYGLTLIVTAVFWTSSANAGDLTIPHSFSPNTSARAASVNENFSAIEMEVDDNAAVISSLQSAHGNTRTSYISVGAGAFEPTYSSDVNFNRVGGMFIEPGDVASNKYIAGISLPHGAVITSFAAYLFDNSASESATANLMEFCSYPETTLASVTTSDNIYWTWYADSTIDSPDVDNSLCTYNIQLDLSAPGQQFFKAVIQYQYVLD